MIAEADTLYAVIQVAVALAGFATVAVAVRDEKSRDLQALRLFNLIICAFGALTASALVILCMHAGVAPGLTFKAASVSLLVGFIAGTLANWRRIARIRKQFAAGVPLAGVVAINAVILCGLVAQAANIALWAAFWPVLLGVYVLLGLACFSFIQLLQESK